VSRVMKGISIGLPAFVVASGLSCDPRSFDDLEDSTWVQFAERNDSQAPGNFGLAVTAVAVPTTQKGARFIVSSRGPAGLSQVTFDEHGSKVEQIGSSISPSLAPLVADSSGSSGNNIFTLSPFVDGTGTAAYVAGQFLDNGLGRAAVMPVGLKAGTELSKPANFSASQLFDFGIAIATGDLGTTGSTRGQDIVVVANSVVTVYPGNGSAARACNINRSNSTVNGGNGALHSVIIAPVKKNGHSQILVGVNAIRSGIGNNVPEILVLDESDIADGAACPETKGLIIDADGGQTASAIVVGDFDGNGNPDIAFSQTYSSATGSSTPGAVSVFMNPTGFTSGTPQKIMTTVAADGATPALGSVLAAADLDGVAGDELIVADPGNFTVKNVTSAGQVLVLKAGNNCPGGSSANRGPLFCVLTTLYNPDPKSNGAFGQAMAVTPYPTASSPTSVLAIAETNKLWVYFRVVASATDPRQ